MKRIYSLLLILLLFFTGCKNNNDNHDFLILLGIALLSNTNANGVISLEHNYNPYHPTSDDTNYLELHAAALDQWQVGFATHLTSATRVIPDETNNTYNPKNWMTALGDDCTGPTHGPAIGVTQYMVDYCYFNNPDTPNVVGVCWMSSYSSGEILQATTLLRTRYIAGYFNEPFTLPIPVKPLMVTTHEIGHCIGFKHYQESPDRVMWPYVSENSPHQTELDAAKYVYYDPTGPGLTRNAVDPYNLLYYQKTSGDVIRHFQFPRFVLSGELIPPVSPSSVSTAKNFSQQIIQENFSVCADSPDGLNTCLNANGLLAEGDPIDYSKEITTTAHLLFEDGTARKDTYKKVNGKLVKKGSVHYKKH
ncbi:MAG: hypothetical protein OEZ34_13400 [Spirochaetia bacterium]|nr:hypothetical protein [Spirochaetia bacterium]